MCPVWLLVAVTLVGVAKSAPTNQCWEPVDCEELSDDVMAKRSYSMEHFRWGKPVKPVGKKRLPLQADGANDVELPEDVQRRELAGKMAAAAKAEQEKKGGTYKISHFRWGGPPPPNTNSKRQVALSLSNDHHDDDDQQPLLTLVRGLMEEGEEPTEEEVQEEEGGAGASR